jgi:hypothetical protein
VDFDPRQFFDEKNDIRLEFLLHFIVVYNIITIKMAVNKTY